MKRFLMLTALAMVAAAPVVMAEGYGDGRGSGGHGGRGVQMLKMLFRHHDVDKDGVITKYEFLKVSKERFERMDADSDGKVTGEEAKEHAKKMKKRFMERRKQGEGNPPSDAE
ncbi:MAG: hypothetical protein KAJ29_04555 [Alphaproteobacteria bacterium]|nr:hypothetical protein [Alphaproteobacteria bacterium]